MNTRRSRVAAWVRDVLTATHPGRPRCGAISPLAVEGPVLGLLEETLPRETNGIILLRVSLTEDDARTVPLADALLREMQGPRGGGLLGQVVRAVGEGWATPDLLDHGSPVRIPLKAIARHGGTGLSVPDGWTPRAVTDVLRVAWVPELVRAAFVAVEGLGGMWCPDVPSQTRARFLRDLLSLVNQGLEGAPVAVAVSWDEARRNLWVEDPSLYHRLHI